MGIVSDKNQRSYAFKKVVGNRQTDPDKQWYNEQSGILSNPHSTEVWMTDIPMTPPISTTSEIQVFNTITLTEDVTVPDKRSWLAQISGSQLNDFIPPRFGNGYFVRVFDNNLNEILTIDNSVWVFDYKNGVLWFEFNPETYGHTAPIKLKVYRYIGETLAEFSGSGGSTDYREFIPVKMHEYLTSEIPTHTSHTLPNSETFMMSSGSYLDVYFNGMLMAHTDVLRPHDYQELTTSSVEFNFRVPASNTLTYIIKRRPVTDFIPSKTTEYLTADITAGVAHTLPSGETFAMDTGLYLDIFFNGQLLTHNDGIRPHDYYEFTNSSIKFNFNVPTASMMTYIIRKRP